MRKLTLDQVIDRLQSKIDRMELRMFNLGLNLPISDSEEYEAKIEAFTETIELLKRVREAR